MIKPIKLIINRSVTCLGIKRAPRRGRVSQKKKKKSACPTCGAISGQYSSVQNCKDDLIHHLLYKISSKDSEMAPIQSVFFRKGLAFFSFTMLSHIPHLLQQHGFIIEEHLREAKSLQSTDGQRLGNLWKSNSEILFVNPGSSSVFCTQKPSSLMVLGCIRAYGTGNLHGWKGTSSSERLIQVLEQHMLLSR